MEDQHPLIVPPRRYFHCDRCPRYFKTPDALAAHRQNTKRHDVEISPYLIFNGTEYRCTLCDRRFDSKQALYLHCAATSRHAWCARCERVFVTGAALDTHIAQSAKHNACDQCLGARPDFEEPRDLVAHMAAEHFYCAGCNVFMDSEAQLLVHDRYYHFICDICREYFSKDTDLRAHRQTHQPRNMQCIGCERTFRSFSGVLVHIESATCKGGLSAAWLNDIAYQYLLCADYTAVEATGEWWYKCPGCLAEFNSLSCMYQHVERVPACSHHAGPTGCLELLRLQLALSAR